MKAIIGKVDKRFNLTYTTIESKGEIAYLGKILVKMFKDEESVDELLVGELSEIKPDGSFKIAKLSETMSGNPGELTRFIESEGIEDVYIFDTSIDVWLYYNSETEEFDPLRTVMLSGKNKTNSRRGVRETYKSFTKKD